MQNKIKKVFFLNFKLALEKYAYFVIDLESEERTGFLNSDSPSSS